MSSKAASTMSEENHEKSALVPRLRFPGFQQSWEYKELGPYLKGSSERVSGNTDLPIYSSTRSGLTPQRDYFDGKELINEGEYGVVPDGYFVYRHMSDDGAFKFNINKTGTRIAVSKEYPVFKSVGIHPEFLRNSLNEGGEFARFALMQKKGGTRTRLYFSTLCSWSMLLPTYDEQQKIADCLFSLDELITAETQKLDALKTHKKGLMQQLFPREGETGPWLRFPEYQGYRHSGFKTIGELAKVTTGGRDTQNKVDDGKYPFFVRSQSVERIDTYSYDGEAVLTSGDGVGVGENYHYIDGRFDFHQRVYCICDFNDSVSGRFFFHYFSLHFKKRVKQMSAKNSVDSVRMPMITEMPIWLPTIGEQERIADCLSSLDDLITTQGQKIDALKTHKKGLMQQLFPVLDEAQV